MIYANALRLYEGKQNLFDAAMQHKTLTVNTGFGCGGINGTWTDNPFREIVGKPMPMPAEIKAIIPPTERTLQDPVPALYEAVVDTIKQTWRLDAFHIIFHSSGWDSRIISSAIRRLVAEDDGWLGKGVLFISNRWEADVFAQTMDAMGWSYRQYMSYDKNVEQEHFRRGLALVWKSAPLPIPGNLWHYIPELAKERGLIPAGVPVQAFTGLWANEAWNCFLMDNNPWQERVETWYSYNTMASLPVDADFVEYPLVSTNVLGVLRRAVWPSRSGDALRKTVALYGAPETADIPNLGLDDRWHKIGNEFRTWLDREYKKSWFGKKIGWIPPTDSNFSTEWGRFSTAMLIEKLREKGVTIR